MSGKKKPTVSPVIRQFAREKGIPDGEIDILSGSGKNGALTKADVRDWAARRAQAEEPDDLEPLDEGDEAEMPPMDPRVDDDVDVELQPGDGDDEPRPNQWASAVEESRKALEDARNNVVEETKVVRRVARLNPMRHKRWKPDRYRIAKKRPGWKCRFVRKSDVTRYRGEGYSIATTRHYLWDGQNVGAQLTRGVEPTKIVVNNCILMEIDEESAAARKEFYENMARANRMSPVADAVAAGAIQQRGHFGGRRGRPTGRTIERTTKVGEGFW